MNALSPEQVKQLHALPVADASRRNGKNALYYRSWRLKNIDRERAREKETKRLSRISHPERDGVIGKKWRSKNKGKIKETNRENYQKNRKQILLQKVSYHKINAARISAVKAECRKRNAVRDKIKRTLDRKENVDKWRVIDNNKRVRRGLAGGTLSRGIVKRLLNLQRFRCACCDVDVRNNFHLDHILPIALGGRNDDLNVQILCPPCNMAKRAKHPVDFMQSRGFLL